MDGLETNNLDRLGILTATIGGRGEEDYLLWLIMAETDRARLQLKCLFCIRVVSGLCKFAQIKIRDLGVVIGTEQRYDSFLAKILFPLFPQKL